MPPKKATTTSTTAKRKAGSAVPDPLAAYPPIKPKDGDPITRFDLQWDALRLIFADTTFQFTPPTYTNPESPLYPTTRTWTFAELYLDCLANSSKATRNLRDKMGEAASSFAINFAKLALLINVGRMNTTLAFYPEMKTALRTFHPIPCMMKDETSARFQDSPRMKSQLKGCAIPQEIGGPENMPASIDVLRHRSDVLGWKPTTCVVQLIFLLYTEHVAVSRKYFQDGFVLHDLLFPTDPIHSIPAQQRADAFLRLVHRFLETPQQIGTDFAEPTAKLPDDQLLHFEKTDCTTENIDTPEEIALGEQMRKDRHLFNERNEKMKEEALSTEAGSRQLSPVPLLAPPTASEANAPHPMHGGTLRTPSSSRKKRARSIASHDGNSTPGSRNASPLHYNGLHEASHDLVSQMDAAPPAGASDTNASRVPQTSAPGITAVVPTPLPYSELESLVQIAMKRLKRDVAAKRDPVYDSDDDLDATQNELRARMLCI